MHFRGCRIIDRNNATTGNVDRGELWGSKNGACLWEVLLLLAFTAELGLVAERKVLDCASMRVLGITSFTACFQQAPDPDPCVFFFCSPTKVSRFGHSEMKGFREIDSARL